MVLIHLRVKMDLNPFVIRGDLHCPFFTFQFHDNQYIKTHATFRVLSHENVETFPLSLYSFVPRDIDFRLSTLDFGLNKLRERRREKEEEEEEEEDKTHSRSECVHRNSEPFGQEVGCCYWNRLRAN